MLVSNLTATNLRHRRSPGLLAGLWVVEALGNPPVRHDGGSYV